MSSNLDSFIVDSSIWKLHDGKLTASLTFADFQEAFSFMTKVAALAEKLNHHPDWNNSYNKVSIELWSHEAGVVTDKDIELARAIQELL